MTLNGLSLWNWRNYLRQDFEFHPRVNFIFGCNAQGKTNLLEAVYLLSSGSAFRAVKDNEAVAFDAHESKISGRLSSPTRDDQTVEITVPSLGRKKILINGVPSVKTSSLFGLLPAVLFCPDDLDLIRNGPAARRKLADSILSQLRPRYANLLSQYGRLLDQKGALLKKWQEKPDLRDTLPEFNARLAELGAQIITFRAAFVRLLSKYAPILHEGISGGEQLTLTYKTVSSVLDPGADTNIVRQQLAAHLNEKMDAELASSSCLSGPHRDDIEIGIDGRSARLYASQGQCRTAAISLRLACRDLMAADLSCQPLLLLDDILSELDSRRQDFVLNRIQTGQIFITGCEGYAAEQIKQGRIFHINGGSVSKITDY